MLSSIRQNISIYTSSLVVYRSSRNPAHANRTRYRKNLSPSGTAWL